MAVELGREEFSVAWQGVIYEAIYSGRRYQCLIASHHLKLKIGTEALAEFRARLPDVERATEAMLEQAQTEIDQGRRSPSQRLIVPLAP